MMREATREERINHGPRGTNFMTPDKIGFYWYPGGVIELSTGDFMGSELYGVTVAVNHVSKENSKCLHSLAEAQSYIKELQKEN